MKKITWKFHNLETKKYYVFFGGILVIGSHYSWVKSYGLQMNFDNGVICNFKKILWPDKTVLGKIKSITIRTGKRIFIINLTKMQINRFFENINMYKIN